MHEIPGRVRGGASVLHRPVFALALAGATILIGGPSAAQETPRVEIGTAAGVTFLTASGTDGATHVAIPAGIGPQFSPVVYVTVFATPSVMVEPQVAFSRTSFAGITLSSFTLVGQLGYLFGSSAASSPYVAAGVGFQWDDLSGSLFSGSSSGGALGGEVGYRFVVNSALAVRLNGRYRRWYSDYSGLNEFGFAVALGGTL